MPARFQSGHALTIAAASSAFSQKILLASVDMFRISFLLITIATGSPTASLKLKSG
jgi:hypothetical protein